MSQQLAFPMAFVLVLSGACAGSASAAPPALSSEITVSALDNKQYSPAVAYDSKRDEYLVVWENVWPDGSHDIDGQRVSSTGAPLGGFALAAGDHDAEEPSVAYDPVRDRYLVVWEYDVDGDGKNWDLYGAFVPWNGPPSGLPTSFVISDWISSQFHPQVVYGTETDEFLVVWMNSAAGVPTYISARRVFADGSGFAPGDGFTVSSGPAPRDFPSVTYNPARNEYLVSWEVLNTSTGLDVYAERLAANGNPIGGVAAEFAIANGSNDEEHPAAAACAGADQYLVAFQLQYAPEDADLLARFVAGDGTPGATKLIQGTTASELYPAASCDPSGQRYLVAWQQQYAVPGEYFGIGARNVFPDESLGDSFGLVQNGYLASRKWPAVAGGLDNDLVVWEHERSLTLFQDIHGRLVAPEPGTTALAAVAALAALARRRPWTDR